MNCEPIITSNETALVVDDDTSVRRMNSLILETMGMTVHSATCGADAFELFKDNHSSFTVAILDLDMPDMTGFDLCNKIRGIRDNLPIIFISGACPANLSHQLEKSAPAIFLMKPYEIEQLQNVVEIYRNKTTYGFFN